MTTLSTPLVGKKSFFKIYHDTQFTNCQRNTQRVSSGLGSGLDYHSEVLLLERGLKLISKIFKKIKLE